MWTLFKICTEIRCCISLKLFSNTLYQKKMLIVAGRCSWRFQRQRYRREVPRLCVLGLRQWSNVHEESQSIGFHQAGQYLLFDLFQLLPWRVGLAEGPGGVVHLSRGWCLSEMAKVGCHRAAPILSVDWKNEARTQCTGIITVKIIYYFAVLIDKLTKYIHIK